MNLSNFNHKRNQCFFPPAKWKTHKKDHEKRIIILNLTRNESLSYKNQTKQNAKPLQRNAEIYLVRIPIG